MDQTTCRSERSADGPRRREEDLDTDPQNKPKARTKDVLTSHLGDELVVFDTRNQKVHNLNGPASAVWGLSDGTRSISEIALGAAGRGHLLTVETVKEALDRLAAAHLLDGGRLAEWSGSRREVLKKAAIGAVIPVVATLASPLAASAACVRPGDPGTVGGTACCSGNTGAGNPKKCKP